MLEGITWMDFLIFLGGLLLPYWIGVIVVFRGKGARNCRHPASAGQPEHKRVWHVQENSDAFRDAIVDESHKAYMGPAGVDPIEMAQEPPAEFSLEDALEGPENILDGIIARMDEHATHDELVAAIRKEVLHNPGLGAEEIRPIIVKLIIQKVWSFSHLLLAEKEVAAFWQK